MKRDRDEFEADHHREPSWMWVLTHRNVLRIPGWFDDPSQEWDCASPEEARCRMLPLGFMVGTSMIREAEKFVDTSPLNINIHDPCVWVDDHPYTPLEWAVRSGTLNAAWVEVFWRMGLSASTILSYVVAIKFMDIMVRSRIKRCRQMEDSIMAMVWCCRQAQGTAWLDVAAIAAERMRRVSVEEWVGIRRGFDV